MIVREGYPFIIVAAVLAVFVGLVGNPLWAIAPLVLMLYFAYFFRNPERKIPEGVSTLVSPADGKVMDVVSIEYDDFIKGPAKKVVIFLSVFDVHVNRSPMEGVITYQSYFCGRFKPAFKDSVGFENERHMIGIENETMRITVTQIAGILARRIVSWVTLDDCLDKGECYGLIRFGSCTEVVMPDYVDVLVQKGDKVVGGESIIGRISN